MRMTNEEIRTDNTETLKNALERIEELKRENESLENIKNIYIGDLLKTKSIIKDYMIVVKGANITVCSVPEEKRCINVLKLNESAEQFLKEVSE